MSPVAAKPSYSRDDEDFVVDGSGVGGSGAGPDDEDDEEDEEEEDADEDVDAPPAMTEPPARAPVPEKKPEVVVVPQPTVPSVAKEFQPPAPAPTQPTHAEPPAEAPTTSPPVDPNASDVHVIDHKPDDRPAFFAQPGILAGIVFVLRLVRRAARRLTNRLITFHRHSNGAERRRLLKFGAGGSLTELSARKIAFSNRVPARTFPRDDLARRHGPGKWLLARLTQ